MKNNAWEMYKKRSTKEIFPQIENIKIIKLLASLLWQ